jgi:hypothetical protein
MPVPGRVLRGAALQRASVWPLLVLLAAVLRQVRLGAALQHAPVWVCQRRQFSLSVI